MTQVSLFRLYLLRATYLLIVVGLGFQIWPALIERGQTWDLWRGVTTSLLAAVSLMAVLGIRYPLLMLPLLLFELVWKSTWLGVIALPLWSAHRLPADMVETAWACLMGVIFLIAIPWPYVLAHYVRTPGDRWR